MEAAQPRVQTPSVVSKGEVFLVRTVISHPMETGLRHDPAGQPIPRRLIHSFACTYNGETVFSADLREAVSANPFLAFHVRASESGALHFVWEEDGGAVFTLDSPLTVRA